jgi:transcriptional regulator with XRE-family HTH domain
VKKASDSPFGTRLRQAFGGARNTIISEKIGVTPSTMTEYMRGDTYPDVAKLIKISAITKCSIHWLLTGEDEADVDPLRFLGPSQRAIIKKLADDRGVAAEEYLREMVTDSLVRLSSELMAQYRTIHPTELEQLQVLFKGLFEVEQEQGSATSRETSSSKRQAS